TSTSLSAKSNGHSTQQAQNKFNRRRCGIRKPLMNLYNELFSRHTRRYFFGQAAAGLGAAALASVANPRLLSAAPEVDPMKTFGDAALKSLHHKPKAKRVIWLFMADGPSQMDLFDYKPKMVDYFDKDLPDSVRNGQRITTMTSGQARFPIAPTTF